jgi:hypothetical protein
VAEEPQSVSLVGFGKRIGLTGPNAFPWFLILVLMTMIGYMMLFNLARWGDPINLKKTIESHTERMTFQHQMVWEAVDRNTYIQWACSPNNVSQEARRECTTANPMRPESMDNRTRRYRIPGE